MKKLLSIYLILFSTTVLAQQSETKGSEQSEPDIEENILEPVNNKTKKMDSVDVSLSKSIDSIAIAANPDFNTPKIDSLRDNTKTKIDSLKALNLSYGNYSEKLDSLNGIVPKRINGYLSDGGKRVNEKIDTVKAAIISKIPGKENLPQANLPKRKLPGGEKVKLLKDQGTSLGNIEADILPNTPELDVETDILPATSDLALDDQLGSPLKIDGKVNEYKSEAGEISNLPKGGLEKIKETEGIDKITNGVGEAKKYGDNAAEYQQDIATAKEGDLEGVEKRAEKEAVKQIGGTGELQNQSNDLNQELGQLDEYRDEAFIKQQMKEKALVLVTKQFAPNTEKFKLAQANLEKYKKKHAVIKNFKNIQKENKSFRERLVLGLDLEMARNNGASMDFAPALGYQFTNRFTSYFGYMYRFSFDKSNNSLNWNNPTYGARGTITYTVSKGIFGKLSFEQLRTNVPRGLILAETSRQWVYGGFIGLGKAYSVTKRIKGNLQMLYNFLHSGESPYSEKYNIRLGFDLSLRRNKTKHVNNHY